MAKYSFLILPGLILFLLGLVIISGIWDALTNNISITFKDFEEIGPLIIMQVIWTVGFFFLLKRITYLSRSGYSKLYGISYCFISFFLLQILSIALTSLIPYKSSSSAHFTGLGIVVIMVIFSVVNYLWGIFFAIKTFIKN